MASICILAPNALVKAVKDAIEHRRYLDKTRKIVPVNDEDLKNLVIVPKIEQKPIALNMIPTNYNLEIPTNAFFKNVLATNAHNIAVNLGIDCYISQLFLSTTKINTVSRRHTGVPMVLSQRKLARAIQSWMDNLCRETRASLPVTESDLLALGKTPYTIYPPLLLLSTSTPKFMRSGVWSRNTPDSALSTLFDEICSSFNVTHIAINAPIPLVSASDLSENVLRSPKSLLPLHGDFGKLENPSRSAFDGAFWVSTRQYGVHQTWAPLYTMFSHGNVSEKARILDIVAEVNPRNSDPLDDCSAVDLYAGIGYFAFYYAKAGVKTVLCWELNPWSVEGFRRGAGMNRWNAVVVDNEHELKKRVPLEDEKFVIFQEDNSNASSRIESIRREIPPVRHVNCGFLPSSRESWRTAVEVLDPLQGGWVHAHENIGIKDIDTRKSQIVQVFDSLVNPSPQQPKRIVQCQHLQRVKSYAPGVMHCVLDIHIGSLPEGALMQSTTQPSS